MEGIVRYLDIARRRWPVLLALPLLAALISLAIGIGRPATYQSSVTLLLTRADSRMPGGRPAATSSFDTQDTLAYDLPAIVQGEPFARLLAERAAAAGLSADAAAIRPMIDATTDEGRPIKITATAPSAALAEALTRATVDLVRERGLRLWGDRDATPEQNGINLTVLVAPTPADSSGGLRSLAREVGLRAAAGLILAMAVVFGEHYLRHSVAP